MKTPEKGPRKKGEGLTSVPISSLYHPLSSWSSVNDPSIPPGGVIFQNRGKSEREPNEFQRGSNRWASSKSGLENERKKKKMTCRLYPFRPSPPLLPELKWEVNELSKRHLDLFFFFCFFFSSPRPLSPSFLSFSPISSIDSIDSFLPSSSPFPTQSHQRSHTRHRKKETQRETEEHEAIRKSRIQKDSENRERNGLTAYMPTNTKLVIR
jgi:hypothetical protein